MKIVSPIIEYFKATGKMKSVGAIEGDRSDTIVIPVSSTQNNAVLYFNPDESITSANIKSIEVLPSETLGASQFNGRAYDNIPLNNTQYGLIVLSNIRREIIATFPLSTLVRSTNQGKATYVDFTDVVWENCYVIFPNLSGSGISTNNCVTVRLYYNEKSLL
jgi:hypothetical protein